MKSVAALVLCTVALATFLYVQSPTTEDLPVEELKVSVDVERRARHTQVLKNIVNLKSYASAAYRMANKMKNSHGSMGHSVVAQLLTTFGKSSKINLVSQYAKAIGVLRARYRKGFNSYLVAHIDKAIVTGKGITKIETLRASSGGRTMIGTYVLLDHKVLGFQSRPRYLLKLAQRFSRFSKAHFKAQAASKNADHAAAAAWLAAGSVKKFKSFGKQIHNHIRKRLQRHEFATAHVAMAAERRDFKRGLRAKKRKNDLAFPLSPASQAAGRKFNNAHPFNAPSAEKIKAHATALAKAWSARAAKTFRGAKGEKRLIKKMEWDSGAEIRKARAARRKGKLSGRKIFHGTKNEPHPKYSKARIAMFRAEYKIQAEKDSKVHKYSELHAKYLAREARKRALEKKAKHAKKVAKEKAFKKARAAEKAAKRAERRMKKAKEQKAKKKVEMAKKAEIKFKKAEERRKKAERRAEKLAKKRAIQEKKDKKLQKERDAKHRKRQEKRAKKAAERAHKNTTVLRQRCRTDTYWDGCTAHPISWYPRCTSGGSQTGAWSYCGSIFTAKAQCRKRVCWNARWYKYKHRWA